MEMEKQNKEKENIKIRNDDSWTHLIVSSSF